MFVLLYLRSYLVRHSKNQIYINYNLNLHFISCYIVFFPPKSSFCMSFWTSSPPAGLFALYTVVKICVHEAELLPMVVQTNAPEELHVREFMSVLNHGLHKLLEDSIHISRLSWPDTLQKTNVASIRSKDQSNIRILLSSFYWNSMTG